MRVLLAYYFFLLLSIVCQVKGFFLDAFWPGSDWFHSLAKNASDSLVPSDFDFWRSVKDLGDKANEYKENMLKDAILEYPLIAEKIKELKEAMDHIVTNTEALATVLQHVDLQEFQNQFEVERVRVFEQLKEEFSEPLPEDQTERYQQQKIRIARALDMIEDGLVVACHVFEIPEVDVRTKFNEIKPHILHFLLIIANLINNHPFLFEVLHATAIFMLLGVPILGPILRIFGFGPLGPRKGSFAPIAQRLFFGAAVTEGSWFATLQRAGTKIRG